MRMYPAYIPLFALMLAVLVVAIILLSGPKPSYPKAESNEAGCACAAQPEHVTKFLIFWKEKKEGEKAEPVFKISDKLFDHITDAWKTVPPNAAEVRIITVRLD